MDAYVGNRIKLIEGGAHVSTTEIMVAKGTIDTAIYRFAQIKYQRCLEIYYHGIYWIILCLPLE